MPLNIFPRRRDADQAPAAPEPSNDLPEPSPEALDDLTARPRTRSRGGRGRGRGAATAATTSDDSTEAPAPEEAPAAADGDGGEPAPRPARRRPSRSRAAIAEAAAAAEAVAAEEPGALAPAAEAEAAAPAPSGESVDSGDGSPEAAAEAPRGSRGSRRDGREPREPREPRDQREQQPRAPRGEGDIPSLLRAIEQQQRQIEQLIRMQEDGRRGGSAGPGAAAPSSAPPARVGIFVDSANIELACDRLRVRFDWGRVLRMFTEGRQLVRALAYSPVHDDPNVSIETQRFVEPFLDKGYKVVTKPLRRFQDGTIKANVDIELALDVISMLDRLDIVVLASGDGDFQSLVEMVQSRGVRVEVAAVGSSTATNLKHAADVFIDLASRARDLRA